MALLPPHVAALRRGADLWVASGDPEVAQHGEVLAGWVDTGGHERLGVALGVEPDAGEAHWRTMQARAERDEALRQAARQFGLSARELAAAGARYEAGAWLRERGGACPARHVDRLESFLHRALTAWPRMPAERQIRSIVGNSLVGSHCREDPLRSMQR